MASELSLDANFTYDDGINDPVVLSVAARVQSITGKTPMVIIQTIGTAEEAIDLGDTAGAGAFFAKNLDFTNFVELRVSTAGAVFARLDPDTQQTGKGGFAALSRLGSGAAAPTGQANTAACRVAFFICPP